MDYTLIKHANMPASLCNREGHNKRVGNLDKEPPAEAKESTPKDMNVSSNTVVFEAANEVTGTVEKVKI